MAKTNNNNKKDNALVTSEKQKCNKKRVTVPIIVAKENYG